MQLEDIKEENNKFLKKVQKEEQELEFTERTRNDLLSTESTDVHTKSEQRRGSHLLSAAGIGFERRHKQHTGGGTSGSRIFQDGDEWMEEKDGKIKKLEVLEVKEKMGNMRKSVPTLPVAIAVILCLFNVILPSIGTFIGVGTLLCCGKCRHRKSSTGIKYGILAGVLQILLTPLLVGWIFSIYYGVNIVQDSISKAAYKTDEMSVVEEENITKNKPTPTTEGSKTQAWV